MKSLKTPLRYPGGKWTFVDYDIVIVNSQSSVEVIKNDTICINSFNDVTNQKSIKKNDC